MPIILDGKKLSKEILEDLRRKVEKSGKKLTLAAVLIGEDKNSQIFLREKEKACQKIGVDFQLFKFSENISQEDLEEEIKKICGQENHGIIIQLPLPQNLDTQKILDLIPAKKNIDVFPISPVVAGIQAFLREYKIDTQGKKVAVIGRGRLVGQPVVKWLKKQNIEIIEDIQKADVIISGVGKQGFVIKGDMIKNGAVVIDAAGDVDFQSVAPKASYITPVFGGLGPLTVAMALKNLILLNQRSSDRGV